MNEKPTIEVGKVPVITKFIYTLGVLPTSYLMSMTYQEQVTWLCNYIQTTLIPQINEDVEAIQELQTLYELLRTYVNDYFDNLDVQEEINNKLDEMAESGQLTDIIAQYLGLAGMIAFDNVTSMKEAQNLVNGSKCTTLGFYQVNDNGNAIYKVRTVTNDDVIDEKTIIALYDNTLVAELVTKAYITPEMVGAKGDGLTDDYQAIQTAINYGSEHNIPVIMEKTYSLKHIITLKNNLSISGKGSLIFDIDDFDFAGSIFCVKTENFDDYTLTLDEFNHNISFKDITIIGKGGTSTIYNIFGISNTINFSFNNIHIQLNENGRFEPFDFRGGNINTKITNCLIEDLQNNSKPTPAGGCIFRQYNENHPSTIKIENTKFIKKNADDVIFVNITNDIDEFLINNCEFEIGKGQALNKSPDNCLTLITSGTPKVNIIYKDCLIHAYNFNEYLLISNDAGGNSSVTFDNCNIISESSSTGIFGKGVNFINSTLKIGNSVSATNTPAITIGSIENCLIELLTNMSYILFQNIEYIKDSIIIGNEHTCTGLCNNVRKFINNFVDGVKFNNCFIDVQKIFNNQIYRYNETSANNNILYFNNVTDCVCKNNYFDFWAVIDVKTGVSVWFTGNESAVRFSLTNNGTFKNCNNVGDQGFVGTGWNDSGNNIVL